MVRKIIKSPILIFPLLTFSVFAFTSLTVLILENIFIDTLYKVAIGAPMLLLYCLLSVNVIHYYDTIASHIDPITTLVAAKLNGEDICPECCRFIIKYEIDNEWVDLYKRTNYPDCFCNYCAVKNAPLIVRILLWRIWL